MIPATSSMSIKTSSRVAKLCRSVLPEMFPEAIRQRELWRSSGPPGLTLFGAAQVEDWAAIDAVRQRALSLHLPCRPCFLHACPIGTPCLRGLTVKRAVQKAQEVLALSR